MSENTMPKLSLGNSLVGFIAPIAIMVVLILIGVSMTFAMLVAVMLIAVFALIKKFSWKDIEEAMNEGVKSIASAAVIMLLVGALVGTFMASGAIPSMLYYGFKLISPALFLPIAFILSAFVAICTGTSWGAVGTIGVVLIGMSAGMNIPLWYTAGAVISGAQMGDKMSPLSDTTLLAAASAGTTVFEHVVSMFYTTVPAAIITLIIFTFLGLNNSGAMATEQIQALNKGLQSSFNINVFMIIPVVLVLVMSIKHVPAFLTFGAGILVSALFAIIFQGVSVSEIFTYATSGYVASTGVESLDGLLSRGGISSMFEMVAMVIMAGMLSGLLGKLHIMEPIVDAITKKVHSANGIVLATLATAGILAIPGAQYPPLTIPAIAYKDSYDKMDINRAVLSRSMEDLGTLLCAILPYGISTAYYSATLGVDPVQYIPFTFLPFLSIVFAVFNTIFGFGILRISDKVRYRPFYRRSRKDEQ